MNNIDTLEHRIRNIYVTSESVSDSISAVLNYNVGYLSILQYLLHLKLGKYSLDTTSLPGTHMHSYIYIHTHIYTYAYKQHNNSHMKS